MTTPHDSRQFMPDVDDDLPAGPRPMIAILRAVPGHEEMLAAAVDALAAAVRREPGCLEFRALQDLADPTAFYLYEIYASADAFREHLTTPHVAAFFTELARHSTSDATALVQLEERGAN